MAKKRRAGSAKRAGARRKAPSRKRSTARRTTRARANEVDLKAIRRQLEVSAGRLEKMASTRGISTDVVRGRLERMMADLADLCDPNNPDGCGPSMVFPPPPSA